MWFEDLDNEKEAERQKHYRRWGYYDPDDKRVIVRVPFSYKPTINFANKWSYLTLFLFIAFIVLVLLGRIGVFGK